MEIPKDELPEWATGGHRAQPMVEGSEEHTAWKLKYQSVDNWWKQLVEQATKEDMLD